MGNTANYDLTTYDRITDTLVVFGDFRDMLCGTGTNSNTYKIDTQMKANADAIISKQATLVSGTNIRTINGETLLGSTNLVITGSETAAETSVTDIGGYFDSIEVEGVLQEVGAGLLALGGVTGSVPEYSILPLSTINYPTTLAEARDIMSWQHTVAKQSFDSYITAASLGAWSSISSVFTRAWDGTESIVRDYTDGNTVAMGDMDDKMMYLGIIKLASAYKTDTSANDIRDAAREAVDFILRAEIAGGGWPEVYPAQDYSPSMYENYIAFNDDTMSYTMGLIRRISEGIHPFDTDIIDAPRKALLDAAYDRAMSVVLELQLVTNGVKNVWAGIYHPITRLPIWARGWEPNTQMAHESSNMIEYLCSIATVDRTPEIKECIHYAIQWFKDAIVEDVRYDRTISPYFTSAIGQHTWYRFYRYVGGQWIGAFGAGVGVFVNTIQEVSPSQYIEGYTWGYNDDGDKVIALSKTDTQAFSLPAGSISIEDQGAHFGGANVEVALQEIGTILGEISLSSGMIPISAATSLILAYKDKLIKCDNTSDMIITIPLNSSVAFTVGDEIAFVAYGIGTVTMEATVGVLLYSSNSFKTINGQYGSCVLKKTGLDEWLLIGNLIDIIV